MTDTSSTIFIERQEGLIEAEVDGELVALHIENGKCYGFNATATRIWALLADPKSLQQLCNELSGEFDIDPDACAPEVLDLVKDLERDGLVKITTVG